MPARIRPSPVIPDHEVLRKIGGGAYGEVWLARGVTGAMRAVKVVWREDFEDERSFEREFEGILKFEPISRDHPGLVNILHVGRSPDAAFYYYVMQLGDDIRTGREINPIEYEPRTLREDNKQAAGVMWDTNECIDVGLRLAEALHHLHEGGLAHRDVKPSNVIFVNGKAKLADIGLVAARGQRTFVGTEGFVPPEGPGSAQADVYSLGKVLYEIATGKDRMNFPELPEEMPTGADRKRWLELNRIICEVCEPRVSKRKISTAAELAEALRRIQHGKRRRRSGLAVLMTSVLLAGFTGWTCWELSKDSDWMKELVKTPPPPEAPLGMLRVFSTPECADVLDENGILVGTTPTSILTAKVGQEVVFTLRKTGYKPAEVRGILNMDSVKGEPLTLFKQMQVFSPPQPGEMWTDHLGNTYQPVDGHHIGAEYVTAESWQQCEKTAKIPAGQTELIEYTQEGESTSTIVLCKESAADAYCRWLRTSGIKAGFLTEDHDVTAIRELAFDEPAMSERARKSGLRPFHVMIRRIVYGSIRLTCSPPGAEVYLNGQGVGTALETMTIPNVRPGVIEMLIVLEGYKPRSIKLDLAEGQLLEQNIVLEKNQGVVFGKAWDNGIHMRFAPIGPDLMASVWETRVVDYELFVKETGHAAPRQPPFEQGPEHPVVNVSREDAIAFCDWLTQRERKAERIAGLHVYRLPSDLEWSQMAGLYGEEGASPTVRDAHKQKVYPWGDSWQDGEKVGNFADMSAGRDGGIPADRTIPGYQDGFPYTAPVASFPPNERGLYDISGNIQEWVDDAFSNQEENQLGVLRGGGWNTYRAENLYTGSRNAAPPSFQDIMYGFRVVLAKVPTKAE